MSSFVFIGNEGKFEDLSKSVGNKEKLKEIVGDTEKLLSESHLQLSTIAQNTLSKSGIQFTAEAQAKLGESWVVVPHSKTETKPASSIAEQWERINNGIGWLQNSVPEVASKAAQMYAGVYTLGGALMGLGTGGIVLPIVGVAAGVFTFINAVKGKESKPPAEVEKLLSNAEALVSMVKQQEEANLKDLGKIDKELLKLQDAHEQIKLGVNQIKTSLTGATDHVLNLKGEADTALTEAKEKLIASEKSFEEGKALFQEGKTHLEESSKCIQEIIKALNTPVDLSNKEEFDKLMGIIKTLATRAQELNELGIKEMEEAKAKLDDGQRQSNEGTTLLSKANALLDVAVKLHTEATEEAVKKLGGLEEAVDKAEQANQNIKGKVDDIKRRVDSNINALGATGNTLKKVRSAWDSFLSWGAVTLGIIAAVAVVAATLAIAGTGVGAIALAVGGGVVAGILVTVGVKNIPSGQEISNKISTAIFGESKKLQGDELPAKNMVKAETDSLSSSFWGKLMKRESKTVGTAYVHLGDEQKEYRFDLRNQYPIDPKDLKEIIAKAKSEIESDPINFNFDKFEKGFNLKVGEEQHNLLGDLGKELFRDLKKEQKKLKEIKTKELELEQLQKERQAAQVAVEEKSPKKGS
jgi:hypothetical protein